MAYPGWLAYLMWDEMHERYRKCCGEWDNVDKDGYFHPKDGDGSYPGPEEAERGGYTPTWVEYGVNFTREGAWCYYIYDSEKAGYSGSESYGEPIPYDHPDFWEELDSLMHQAPYYAWCNDVCSCPVCGDNYMAGNGHCCEEENEDDG